jgi:tRNA(Arg) A34 adenosine deaminase TadA
MMKESFDSKARPKLAKVAGHLVGTPSRRVRVLAANCVRSLSDPKSPVFISQLGVGEHKEQSRIVLNRLFAKEVDSETGNPLLHGEITAINAFYEVPRDQRPAAKDCIFVCTHEPCPLCLSGITWGGFDNFFYLFSYEDTKDAFNIPHDLRMQEEIFRLRDGNYAQKNYYWSSWGIKELVASCNEKDRERFTTRVERLRKTYNKMSEIYQKSKDKGAEIPLK